MNEYVEVFGPKCAFLAERAGMLFIGFLGILLIETIIALFWRERSVRLILVVFVMNVLTFPTTCWCFYRQEWEIPHYALYAICGFVVWLVEWQILTRTGVAANDKRAAFMSLIMNTVSFLPLIAICLTSLDFSRVHFPVRILETEDPDFQVVPVERIDVADESKRGAGKESVSISEVTPLPVTLTLTPSQENADVGERITWRVCVNNLTDIHQDAIVEVLFLSSNLGEPIFEVQPLEDMPGPGRMLWKVNNIYPRMAREFNFSVVKTASGIIEVAARIVRTKPTMSENVPPNTETND